MSWQTLEDADADLAAFGARRLSEPRVAYLATVDRDGCADPVRTRWTAGT